MPGGFPVKRRAGKAEVTVVPTVSCPPLVVGALRLMVITPCHQVHLYSRPHIDLHRVAGALCSS
ncbi:putative leader peptide [Streptomyces sp. NPDC002889]|uniref:putative leader peptide n=1 Tax=Streptomyces sp. NPDC002889 TaxID=3364669 RepID=UPI0036C9CF04